MKFILAVACFAAFMVDSKMFAQGQGMGMNPLGNLGGNGGMLPDIGGKIEITGNMGGKPGGMPDVGGSMGGSMGGGMGGRGGMGKK